MPRAPITKSVEAGVLLKARRRCCICFGLNRDTSIKQGQIAHLDQNSANSAEDNLAFLCLDHHDQYDSSTRQSKNFTLAEVKQFRAELHTAVALAFGGEAKFGDATAPHPSFAGHYIRGGSYESAELKVELLRDGRYHVSGIALWGTDREYGPNLGELDFVAELVDGRIFYLSPSGDGTAYKVKLEFTRGALDVTEENWVGMFGLNVNFSGLYERAA